MSPQSAQAAKAGGLGRALTARNFASAHNSKLTTFPRGVAKSTFISGVQTIYP